MKMKKAKLKKQQHKEIIVNEEYAVKSMIKILSLLIIIFGAFYFVTTLLIKPKEENPNNPVVIDSSKIIAIGYSLYHMLEPGYKFNTYRLSLLKDIILLLERLDKKIPIYE